MDFEAGQYGLQNIKESLQTTQQSVNICTVVECDSSSNAILNSSLLKLNIRQLTHNEWHYCSFNVCREPERNKTDLNEIKSYKK